MFASEYLNKNNRHRLIDINPDPNCGIIVVIPCFNEPEILLTLESLKNCHVTTKHAEVIVVINHPEDASLPVKANNVTTLLSVTAWIETNFTEKLKFFVTGPFELRKKWAGAGLARKTGMDEAIARFNLINNPEGIVVSLDADTLVTKNYLAEIENHFTENPKNVGATIAFEHQKSGLTEKHQRGIELYELYLKYYKNALEYSGYPFSMFTIGSAFAVTAEAYVKRGGMNRRKAGEDFYFLQNLVQVGPVGEITNATVFPSSRLSNRVPFGTGPILKKWIDGTEDLQQTYNLKAFTDLKAFFDIRNQLFKTDVFHQKQIVGTLPEPIANFIESDNFYAEIDELNKNCSSLKTFETRFFHKFNAFRILKFLNFSHEIFYKKTELIIEAETLEKLQNS